MQPSTLTVDQTQSFADIETSYGDDRVIARKGIYHMVTLQVAGYSAPFLIGGTETFPESAWTQLLRQMQQSLVHEPWRKLVSDKYAPTDAASLQKTADNAFAAIRASGPSAIDLALLEEGEVSGEHLAMLLRCISSWERSLPGWARAIEIAKRALVAEGKDAEDALYGML